MLDKIIDSIQESKAKGLLIKDEKDILSGFSGKKLVGMLQRLSTLFINDRDACYLEVGVFQGLTLLSVAMSCHHLSCYGIDNFAYLDPEGKNFGLVKDRISQLNLNNVNVINKDYEDALENLSSEIGNKKVAIYFIDGPHDYRSQLMCLELVLPYLHENAVIIIDDCNYRHVRQANRDFLVTHSEYKLIFEAYTPCHPKNMTQIQEIKAREGWWNGVNVLVRDSNNHLPSIYPPTERSRQLYENEHIIHSARLAELAPHSLQLIDAITQFNIVGSIRLFARLIQRYLHFISGINTSGLKIYPSMNTYSEHLTEERFNQVE